MVDNRACPRDPRPVRLALTTLVLLALAPVLARAQGEPRATELAAHAAAVQDAVAAGRCGAEASELNEVLVAFRAEPAGVRRRALAHYLGVARSRLDECMAARQEGYEPAPDEGPPRPRGRVLVPSEPDEQSGVGRFDVRSVLAMIRTRQSAMRACYDRELRSRPTLGGRLRVRFTIAPDGRVSEPRAIEDSLEDGAVAQCVVRVVNGFRFAPGPAGGSVTYAFTFAFAPQPP